MNHKVLLADDSLTIQKVIKITLANQPYDIEDCINEEELFQKLPLIQPKLVFLDFNLSEKHTGYELTAKIKSLSPFTKVLLLLGTFDSVDDASMEKCGASDKVVKPFDSNKFIAICKQLMETFPGEDIPYPKSKSETNSLFADDPEDQWTVNHSTEQKFSSKELPLDNSFPGIKNPLMQEVSDWGMSVPNVIDESESHDKLFDVPPVIGEVKSLSAHKLSKEEASKYQTKFPESNDLDYPTMDDLLSSAQSKPPSKLVSIDNFKPEPIKSEEFHQVAETDISFIQEQIKDEVADDLWQVDELEDLKKEVPTKIGQGKSGFRPTSSDFDESLFKPLDDIESIEKPASGLNFSSRGSSASINMEDVQVEIQRAVKAYVKEYMDEFFQKNTEKVAWEVIPDLAENLIRQELSKISNKILNDQN